MIFAQGQRGSGESFTELWAWSHVCSTNVWSVDSTGARVERWNSAQRHVRTSLPCAGTPSVYSGRRPMCGIPS